MKSLFFRSTLAAALSLMIGSIAGPVSGQETLKLGVFPRKPAVETKAGYEPLAQYLSDKTGKKVELVLSKDFKTFWEGVKNREFDIVHYNQYHYIKSRKELDYDVIVMNEEFGSALARSAIVVRKDSGINSISDLKGKKILFGGGKQAMQSYIGAISILKKNGLQQGEFEEQFAVNPPNAALAAYNKMVDAAGIGENVISLKAVKDSIDADQMKVLAVGDPLPMLCWAVKKEMDKGLRDKIAKAMIGLRNDPTGEPLLKGAEVTAFLTASDKDYNVVRKVVKEAIGESY